MEINNIYKIIVLVFLTACSAKKQTELPVDQYLEAINKKETGMFSKTIGTVKYSLQYKPTDYMVLRELKGSNNMSEQEVNELKGAYDKYEYYTFEIAIEGFNNEILKYNLVSAEDYEKRVNYYAFGLQNDLSLVVDKDTIPCHSFHFERNYGLAPNARFLVSFERKDIQKKRTFISNEKYVGGRIKIGIDPEELQRIPKLKIS